MWFWIAVASMILNIFVLTLNGRLVRTQRTRVELLELSVEYIAVLTEALNGTVATGRAAHAVIEEVAKGTKGYDYGVIVMVEEYQHTLEVSQPKAQENLARVSKASRRFNELLQEIK